jgi:curved DNA-binding protein CbpA
VDEKLREALLAIAPRAKERDLFARLGIAESAGREDAKKAFLALAKQFHPDRFASPSLADLQDRVRDFFAAVNEAYEVLSDDRKRLEYLKKRQGGDATRAESAKVDFQKGEACLRTRDFARARGFLESAVRADPRPAYQAALAWAYVSDPASKERERPRALVAEATKDPSCDRAFYVAGIIARDEGDPGLAERHFRAAVQANPRNADAVRELRLVESRRADKRR